MHDGNFDQENQAQQNELFEDYLRLNSIPARQMGYAYMRPQETKKNGVLAMFGLLVSIAIVVGCIFFVSHLLKETISRTNNTNIASTTTYNMKDRARYEEMTSLINSLYDTYTRQDLTGEIWDRFDSETEDYNYVIDYLSELNYYHKKIAGFEDQQSMNAQELDYEIETIINDLKTLEVRFIAKAPLTTNITITLEDGSRVAVAKKTKTSIRYGDVVSAAPSITGLDDELLEKEAWARGFEGYLDSNGSYRVAAAQLAERFDMYLDYNWTNILNKCIGSTENEKNIIAAYCHATPDVVYVNKNATHYGENIRNEMFISTIKHEISHHIIATICGTARPIIAGPNVEGVTNSFANIFLGAKEKNEYYANNPEYHMSDWTDEIARAIHDEQRCRV
jgi:hypothetical protein